MVPWLSRIKKSGLSIDSLETAVYSVPTDGPEGKESDGTIQWSATTIVVVEVRAGNAVGVGYTYTDVAAAKLIESSLKEQVIGKDPFLVSSIRRDLMSSLRKDAERYRV